MPGDTDFRPLREEAEAIAQKTHWFRFLGALPALWQAQLKDIGSREGSRCGSSKHKIRAGDVHQAPCAGLAPEGVARDQSYLLHGATRFPEDTDPPIQAV